MAILGQLGRDFECEKSRLDHFVDREKHQRLADSVVTMEPGHEVPVVVFQGIGGMGKTSVLAKIHRDICLSEGGTSDQKQVDKPIPFAWVDFADAGAAVEAGIRGRTDLLHYIKRELTYHAMSFRCFELVWARYQELKSGQAFEPARASKPEFVTLLEVVQNVGGTVGSVISLIKILTEKAPEWYEQWQCGKLAPRGIAEWRHPQQAADALVNALIQDILSATESGESTVPYRWPILFVDSLEWVAADEHGLPTLAALCQLIDELPEMPVFIASRPPIPLLNALERPTQVVEVGVIPETRRKEYLTSRGIDEASWQPIIEATKGHALWMGVAADIAVDVDEREHRAVVRDDLLERQDERDKLLLRLLERLSEHSSVRDLVRAASVCRWFDRDMLRKVSGKPTSFARDYKRLLNLSFVVHRSAKRDARRHALHETVRDLQLSEICDDGDLALYAQQAIQYCKEQSAASSSDDLEKGLWLLESLYYLWMTDPINAREMTVSSVNEHFWPKWQRESLAEIPRIISDTQQFRSESDLPWAYWWARARTSELRSDFEAAGKAHEEGLARATDQSERVLSLRGCAKAARATGKARKAVELLGEAVRLSSEVGDVDGLVTALKALGISYRRASEWEKALEAYDQAISVADDQLPNRRAGTISSVLNNRAVVLRQSGDWTASVEALVEGLRIKGEQALEGKLNPNNIGINLRNLGHMKWLTGQYEEAKSYLWKSVCVRRHIGNRLGESDCLSVLGAIAMDEGRLGEAGEYLREAASRYSEGGTNAGWITVMIRLVDLCVKRGTDDEANRWLERCDAEIEESDQVDLLVNLHIVRARATMDSAPSSAREDASQALRTATAAKFPWGEAEALHERGRAALSLGDHEAASNDSRNAMAVARELPYPLLEGRSLIQLGLAAKADRREEHARGHWLKAARVLMPMPVTEREQVNGLLSETDRP